jgi:hypothetical protein
VSEPRSIDDLDLGVAGRSAQREHDRRSAADAARVAAARDEVRMRFGGEASETTTAWATGAQGEVVVAARLDGLRAHGVVAMHDRRIPRSRANVDHIAVGPSGVWVVDAKRYAGKRPAAVTQGGLLGFGGTRRLTVGGRRRDGLVDGVLAQVERVRSVLPDDVPVFGMLCFVDADWPLLGGHLTVRGVRVVWPRRMAKEIAAHRGAPIDVPAVSRIVADAFPPA